MTEFLSLHAPAVAVLAMFIAAPLAFLLGDRIGRAITLAVAMLQLVLSAFIASVVATSGPIEYMLGGWGAPLGIDYRVDGLSAAMILLTAVVGTAVTTYATAYFSDKHKYRFFWPLWMFMWGALVAVFSVNDAFNYYVCIELVSISAISLVAIAGKRAAIIAAMRYLFAAVAGSMLYLFGVALIYAGTGALDLTILREVTTVGPTVQAGLSLAVVGLVVKTALVPMHFWLPPAHANAATPVSAILSALVIKGSFYILLRLATVLGIGAMIPGMPLLLGLMGATAIVWGSVQALKQVRLKMLVAYSTVAQIGYLFVLFPLVAAAATPEQGATAVTAGVFHALSHGLAKGAMFLAAGAILVRFGTDRIDRLVGLARTAPAQAAAFAIAGVAMLGLPPSGGFVSKWLYVQAALDTGAWWWAVVVLVGGLLAALYVFRVVGIFMRAPQPGAFTDAATAAPEPAPLAASMNWAPLALAVASLLLGVLGQPIIDLIAPAALAAVGGGA